jgi:glycosyltransferase involved in cell wall biosynthesis
MLTRYLVETGHVGRALYFDAPLARTTLESFLSVLQDDPSGQEGPMVRNTFARWLGLLDDDLVRQRVFIHGGTRGPEPDSLVQPAAAEYSAFVSEQLQDAGLDPARTMALVFPVVWDFARVRDAVPFARVIVDLVDDEREFRSRPEYRDRLTSLYEQTILAADLVTANCEPLADRFAYLGTSIHVVPNGAEPFPAEVPPIPPILARLPHPLIGYVGDMRDRIDWDLVRRLVRQRPGWSFVFAGPPGDAAAVGDLRRSPNVVFAGVIEYVDLPAYLRHLDAAIVPHLRSPLTDSMNPLKVYNYVAAGLPVVATAVPNLQDIEASVCYADTAEGFIDALEDALAGRPTRAAPERPAVGLSRYGWKARAEQMGALMDTLFQ